jgi:hypothetical protein
MVVHREKKKEMTECKNDDHMTRANRDCKKRKNEQTVDRLSTERAKEKSGHQFPFQ